MIEHLAYLRCDRCGDTTPAGDNATEVRAIAYAAGWERRNWNKRIKDVCPFCVNWSPKVEPWTP